MNDKRRMVNNLTSTEIAISTTEYAVMRVLIDHADEAMEMRAWPSLPRIAGIIRASRNTTRRAVNNLIASGLIIREAASSVSGIRKRTGYVFNLTPLLEGIGCPTHDAEGVSFGPSRGSVLDPPLSEREGSVLDPVIEEGGQFWTLANGVAGSVLDPQGVSFGPSRGSVLDPELSIELKENEKREEEEVSPRRSKKDRAGDGPSSWEAPSPPVEDAHLPDTSSEEVESPERVRQDDPKQQMEAWVVSKLKNYWLSVRPEHPGDDPLGAACGANVVKIAVLAGVFDRREERLFCLDVEARLEDYRLRDTPLSVRRAYGYLLDDLRERYEARIRGDDDEDSTDPTSYEAQQAALDAAREARNREWEEQQESWRAREMAMQAQREADALRRAQCPADDLPLFISSSDLEHCALWMKGAVPGGVTNRMWLDEAGEKIVRNFEEVYRVNAACEAVSEADWQEMRAVAERYTPEQIDSDVVRVRGIDALDF